MPPSKPVSATSLIPPLGEPLEDSSDPALAKAASLTQTVPSHLFKLAAEVDMVRENRHLSEEGQAAKIAELVEKTQGRSPDWIVQAQVVKDKLAEVEAEFFVDLDRQTLKGYQPAPADAIREAEMRGYLLRMPLHQRLEVLKQAVDDGDIETFRVFRRTPKWLAGENEDHFVPPHELNRFTERWVELHQPARVKYRDSLRNAAERVDVLIRTASVVFDRIKPRR